ncbi:MAG: hypothetical protein M1834_009422 [Cirrosporium novae-zelandiae]|nr:MAG: hypothetical protein M1834_009422 [Cirrosporium novae-zelandiae]
MAEEKKSNAEADASSPDSLSVASVDNTAIDESPVAQQLTSGETPYSIYSKKEKWFIVGMVAVTGLFSPLPANIYFPAIPTLANIFHKSTELMNLTVTVYLVMQGVSPMLWGPLSDRFGRRPIFIICFIILVGSCVGLALTPTDAYWLLLLLRCIQAGGCASTIALGAGVVGDISTPAERGGFFGTFNLGPMLAPCIGPAIGGALAEHLGWRSIFWFLVILAALCVGLVILFLPETMRSLVGNGSIKPPSKIYYPIIPLVGRGKVTETAAPTNVGSRPSTNPFILLTYPDIIVTLLFTGVVYAVNYTITATISSSFAKAYPYLSSTDLGLCYLSSGGGMLVGSTVNGKILDREYRTIKTGIAREKGADLEKGDDDFPIEYARLRTMPINLGIFIICAIGWGWCLDKKVSIAGPLVLQIVLGWTGITILNTTMTLMIDILLSQSSGATACTNFVRCSLGAVLVSLIDKATDSLGMGWTYVLLSGICALMFPLMVLEIKMGPKWRLKRKAKQASKQAN